MTETEDPARAVSASVAQAVAVAATAAELLAQSAARRASDRADTADRHTGALRSQTRANTAAGRLAFDACGDPMPSATAVLPPSPTSGGQRPERAGQVIDGQVVARAYPVPQTARSTAQGSAGGGHLPTAAPTQAQAARVTTAAPPPVARA
jgi:hypothetical protein